MMNRTHCGRAPVERRVVRIYCCGCADEVNARLTDGMEIYPHRPDLNKLPFWKCDACGNYVGCHHKTKNKTAPLGCIPTPELKDARKHLHALIDPIWQSGKMGRRELYEAISKEVGWNYHTAKTRTIEEARSAYKVVKKLTYNAGNNAPPKAVAVD